MLEALDAESDRTNTLEEQLMWTHIYTSHKVPNYASVLCKTFKSSILSICGGLVTSVWSETGIVEALNSDGPRTDIILAEVDLLMANGGQMLRYIVHHKELQHIPVIILATRDQVSITINGLRLGAADYLLKPLQAEELSQLWTHMQKRRDEANLQGCSSRIEGFNI